MYGNCLDCKNLKLLENSSDDNTWYDTWVTENVIRPGAKGKLFSVKITHKKRIDCSLSELIKVFNDLLKKFCIHVFITTHQFKSLHQLKKNLEVNEVYCVLDFKLTMVNTTKKCKRFILVHPKLKYVYIQEFFIIRTVKGN